MKTALLALLFAGAAFGQAWQNVDFTLLVGAAHVQSSVVETTTGPATVSGSAAFVFQFGFGYQLTATKAGTLYLEIPQTYGFYAASEIQGAATTSLSRTTWCFAPGVRFKLPTEKRVSLYGALGAGIQNLSTNYTLINDQLSTTGGDALRPVLDTGAGIDLRLSRWISLRFDFRDYISFGTAPPFHPSHNHLVGLAGVAFHR